MITDGEKWHYLAVKKLCALLRVATSKHDGNFYYLNCFHSCSTKDKLRKHYNVCKNIDYCYVEIPKEDNKILKHNADKSKTIKINEQTSSGYSLFTYCSFYLTKNKLDCYKGKDCMERFCKDLKEHATKTINYEK